MKSTISRNSYELFLKQTGIISPTSNAADHSLIQPLMMKSGMPNNGQTVSGPLSSASIATCGNVWNNATGDSMLQLMEEMPRLRGKIAHLEQKFESQRLYAPTYPWNI